MRELFFPFLRIVKRRRNGMCGLRLPVWKGCVFGVDCLRIPLDRQRQHQQHIATLLDCITLSVLKEYEYEQEELRTSYAMENRGLVYGEDERRQQLMYRVRHYEIIVEDRIPRASSEYERHELAQHADFLRRDIVAEAQYFGIQLPPQFAQALLHTLLGYCHNILTYILHSFFGNSSNGATNPLRPTLSKLFDKYRDDPKNEPDEINVEGTMKMLGEANISLEDIGTWVFCELVSAPTLGKITREGFVDGCVEVNVDSIPKLRNVVLQRRSSLSTDRELFKNVYNHAFPLGLQNNQKSLLLENAIEFWTVLFGENGYQWRTNNTPWLDWWFEFQNEKVKRAVNRDLWKQTLTFAEQTMKDETLSFWSEESSWPSVIDDFVEWVKTEKRAQGGSGGGGDAMEVE